MAICSMPWSAVAPCQCFSPGGIHTVSPARISRSGPPQAWTRPVPARTYKVCPSGWVCHAVRAPGSKLTRADRTRAGDGASMMGSWNTVPVNDSADIRRVARAPQGSICMLILRRSRDRAYVARFCGQFDSARSTKAVQRFGIGDEDATARRLVGRPFGQKVEQHGVVRLFLLGRVRPVAAPYHPLGRGLDEGLGDLGHIGIT